MKRFWHFMCRKVCKEDMAEFAEKTNRERKMTLIWLTSVIGTITMILSVIAPIIALVEHYIKKKEFETKMAEEEDEEYQEQLDRVYEESIEALKNRK